MKDSELKALISLLDEPSADLYFQIHEKMKDTGAALIPYLEAEWEQNLNPLVQTRIENLIHDIQYEAVKERLREWASSPSQELIEGMWAVASYQYPDLEVSKLENELEQVYQEVWLNFKPGLHPYDQVKILNSVLFHSLKFGGNLQNFHSPSNSYLNTVLETRKGNPISLCVVYLYVAKRLNIPIYGVNLPNLFILTYKDDNYPQFYINAYNRGLIFSRADIDNYIREIKLEPHPAFVNPCSEIDIIRRVLRNLLVSYEKAGETEKHREITELLEIVTEGDNLLPI